MRKRKRIKENIDYLLFGMDCALIVLFVLFIVLIIIQEEKMRKIYLATNYFTALTPLDDDNNLLKLERGKDPVIICTLEKYLEDVDNTIITGNILRLEIIAKTDDGWIIEQEFITPGMLESLNCRKISLDSQFIETLNRSQKVALELKNINEKLSR